MLNKTNLARNWGTVVSPQDCSRLLLCLSSAWVGALPGLITIVIEQGLLSPLCFLVSLHDEASLDLLSPVHKHRCADQSTRFLIRLPWRSARARLHASCMRSSIWWSGAPACCAAHNRTSVAHRRFAGVAVERQEHRIVETGLKRGVPGLQLASSEPLGSAFPTRRTASGHSGSPRLTPAWPCPALLGLS